MPRRLEALEAPRRRPGAARPRLPVRWVDTAAGLAEVVAALRGSAVGLDVETTLTDHALRLVQLANEDFVALIDPLAISDLSPLAAVLGSPEVVKVIHNASFERRVLGAVGLEIVNVFDTLKASRALRGRSVLGGNGLAAVCERELGVALDKAEQTSDWSRRPLTSSQLSYAALDAEVLLRLHAIFVETSRYRAGGAG